MFELAVSEGGMKMTGGGAAAMSIMMLMGIIGVWVFLVACICRIVAKLGHPWVMGLLYLIPVVNIVMLAILAFSTSPVEIKLRQYKRQMRQMDQGGDQGQAPRAQRGRPSRGRSGPKRRARSSSSPEPSTDDAASALDDLAG